MWYHLLLMCLAWFSLVRHHRHTLVGIPESSIESSSQCEEDGVRAERKMSSMGEPSFLWRNLSIIFSLISGSSYSGTSNEMVSSGRHSLTSKSLLLSIESLLIVVRWKLSDLDLLYFFFKHCKYRDMKEICITLVRCNQIYLMECIRNGKVFRIEIYIFGIEMVDGSCLVSFYRWLFWSWYDHVSSECWSLYLI